MNDPYLEWISRFMASTGIAELQVVQELAQSVLGRARFIVEIGTKLGALGYHLSAMRPDVYTTIDIPGDSRNLLYLKMSDRCRDLGVHYYPIEASSTDGIAHTLLDAVIGAHGMKPDLLIIDGAHDYATARQDWDTYVPRLADRAVVLVHDITAEPGVVQLWDELVEQEDEMHLYKAVPRGDHGYGVAVKEPDTWAVL